MTKAKKLTYSCTTKFCHVHQFSQFTDWADELHFIAFYHVLSLTGMKLKRKFFTSHTKNRRGHKLHAQSFSHEKEQHSI